MGAIGYRNLRDHSAGFEVVDRLAARGLEPGVTIDDVSYNPIALVQWFQSLAAEAQFGQVVFCAAVSREGRRGGEIAAYRWDGRLPPDDLVQQAVTEAVTGIINLDNTLTIAGNHFESSSKGIAPMPSSPRSSSSRPRASPCTKPAS